MYIKYIFVIVVILSLEIVVNAPCLIQIKRINVCIMHLFLYEMCSVIFLIKIQILFFFGDTCCVVIATNVKQHRFLVFNSTLPELWLHIKAFAKSISRLNKIALILLWDVNV